MRMHYRNSKKKIKILCIHVDYCICGVLCARCVSVQVTMQREAAPASRGEREDDNRTPEGETHTE